MTDETAPPYRPDALDRRLIAILRADGRAPIATLAAALGVARGTAQARLTRLIEKGVILGFAARLKSEEENEAVRATMMIELEGKSTAQAIRKLKGLPEIVSLHTTNGNWDLVAQIRAPTLAEFDRLLREVRLIDGVRNSETSLLLSAV
jgi:DNA-binding Lrp family transcriptional regulator